MIDPAAFTPSSATPTPATWREAEVSESLGVSRPDLRKLRGAHLYEGADWLFEKNAVVYTATGLAKLEHAVRAALVPGSASSPDSPLPPELTPAAPSTPPAALASPAPEPAALIDPTAIAAPEPPAFLTVTRVWPNRKQKLLAKNDAGVVVLVRVRDASLFQAGMVLPAHRSPSGLWHHRGRSPRRKGRW